MTDRVRSSLYISIYGFLLSFSGWYFGYEIGMFNNFFDIFVAHAYPGETDTSSIKSNLSLFIMFGGMIACLTAGYIIDALGRYRSAIAFMVAELLVIAVSLRVSLPLLYITRFSHGYLACAWSFLAPLMIRELMPDATKNFFSGMFYIFLTLGILTSYGLAYDTLGEYWKYVFALPGLIEIPKLLAFVFVFKIESPKWICMRVKDREVRQALISDSLKRIYIDEDVDRMASLIVDESRNAGSSEEVGVTDLVSPQYRKQFLIVLFINFMNQMTGINFLILYSTTVFQELGNSEEKAKTYTFFMGVMNFVGAIAITILATRLSKKYALVAGMGVQAIGYFILLMGMTLKISILAVIGVYVYMISFAMSLGGCMYPYQADVLPAIGISIASVIQWILSTLIGKFGETIIKGLGQFTVFLTLMIVALIGSVVFAGYSITTENKTDAEIKDEFMCKTFMS